jgi:hypothetical protein
VQAAGRISRLGQTKEISLVRLVAKDTVDEAIIEMHEQLASGAKKFTKEGYIPASCIVAMGKKGTTLLPPVEFVFRLSGHNALAGFKHEKTTVNVVNDNGTGMMKSITDWGKKMLGMGSSSSSSSSSSISLSSTISTINASSSQAQLISKLTAFIEVSACCLSVNILLV